ncbi:hypothetical protein EV11_0270 [Prochlorococcus sp. SS52]|nr:hypothetical protein EV04_0180 [Prochlorococcus marinus str. LG]KGG33476.1 hypothetical protein EV10_0685 [Prochlorococcus marinus str. SS51]KGG37394.1 hypothetical protein EV11_0270 [Prochlorococcus sp. SS52]
MSNSVQQIRDWLWMFPSKNSSQGMAAWWLNCEPEPVLIDCPELTPQVINDLEQLSKASNPKILLTSRDGHNKISDLNKKFGWPVLIQEQEAYLLPGIKNLESFREEAITAAGLKLLWTPGTTPGSCVVYAPSPWNVLFCGRLLIPFANAQVGAVRTRNTFHWTNQQNSLVKLIQWLPSEHRPSLASGVVSHSSDSQKLFPWTAWKPNGQ